MSSLIQSFVDRLAEVQVMMISVLVHLVIIIVLAFTVFHYVAKEPPEFSASGGGFVEAAPAARPAASSAAVAVPTQQQFAAAAPQPLSALSVITTPQAQAAFTMPEVAVQGPSADMMAAAASALASAVGPAGGVTSGLGGGSGGGSGAGADRGSDGGGFGSLVADDSKLSGIMYDLKQTRSRKRTEKVSYYDVIADFIESGFNPDVVKGFYRSSPIYTSHIFLPIMPAERGPEAFGLGQKIAPSNWFIHYNGVFTPPHAGRYRFWAMADDTLVAVVDDKVMIDVSLDRSNPGKWAAKAKNFRSGYEFTAGEWMELGEGRTYRLDLIVGERPGGKFKAYLLVEREGEKDAEGKPILRLFVTKPMQGIPDNPDKIQVAPEPLVMPARRSVGNSWRGGTL